MMVQYYDLEENPQEGTHNKRRSMRGRQTPAEKLERMREKNAALTGVHAIEAAREVALRQLDRRARSRYELHTAIVQRGFNDTIAAEVIDRLENVGLVDDAAYATMIVRDRFTLRGAVGRAVVEELRRKGIAPELIARAMEEIDRDSEYERALDLAQRKAERSHGIPRHKIYTRLSGMLARKGYAPSIIAAVLSEVLTNWADTTYSSEEENNEY